MKTLKMNGGSCKGLIISSHAAAFGYCSGFFGSSSLYNGVGVNRGREGQVYRSDRGEIKMLIISFCSCRCRPVKRPSIGAGPVPALCGRIPQNIIRRALFFIFTYALIKAQNRISLQSPQYFWRRDFMKILEVKMLTERWPLVNQLVYLQLSSSFVCFQRLCVLAQSV